MHALYEETGGSEMKWPNMWQLGEKLGFDKELTENIVEYLVGEFLIQYQALGGAIGITHYGVREVEEALENPNQSTEHFAPLATVNIIHVAGSMVNSQVQQSSAGSMQIATINSNQLADLKEIIANLRDIIRNENLTPDQKDELSTEIETLAVQSKASKPKPQRIKESLVSAKNILEGAAVGAMIAVKISALLIGLS